MTYWLKDRPHWKEDEEYLKYDTYIRNNRLTFEDAIEYIKLDIDQTEIEKYKDRWLVQVKDFSDRFTKRAIGFAAIVFLLTEFPYKTVKRPFDGKKLSRDERIIVNNVYRYYHGKDIGFKGIKYDTSAGPLMPAAYMEWRDREHNQNCWWLTYMVYEKLQGLEHMEIHNAVKDITKLRLVD